jgi:hypothetical protein
MEWELESLTAEEQQLIRRLRTNGQLLETDDEDATVPSGVTHILLLKPGQKPKLVRLSIPER